MVLISVVIPTYNRAHLIKDAVQSVLDQTLKDFELIVVDDGSTDNTREVMSDLVSDRVRYIYQENRGASAARNAGIFASSGKYVTFLDSDDLYLPQKLEIQSAEMEKHPEAAMSYHGARIVDFKGNLQIETHAELDGWIYRQTVFRGPINSCILTPAVMVRRSVLEEMGSFEESMHGAEDLDLWRRISLKYQIRGIDQNLCTVRRGDSGGYYSGPDHIFLSIGTYLKRAFQDDPDLYHLFRNPEISLIYETYAQIFKDHRLWSQEEKNKAIRRFLKQAIWYTPFRRNAYDLWGLLLPQSGWSRMVRVLLRAKRTLMLGLRMVYQLGVRIVRRIPDVVRDPKLGVSFFKRFVRWSGRKVKGALRRIRAFVNG